MYELALKIGLFFLYTPLWNYAIFSMKPRRGLVCSRFGRFTTPPMGMTFQYVGTALALNRFDRMGIFRKLTPLKMDMKKAPWLRCHNVPQYLNLCA